MPFRLHISSDEVKSELEKMGYNDVDEQTINIFRKDLLKLIKNDLKNIKKLKQSQDSALLEEYHHDNSRIKYFEPSTSTPTSLIELEKDKQRKKVFISSSSEISDSTSKNEFVEWDKSTDKESFSEMRKDIQIAKLKSQMNRKEKKKTKTDGLPDYPEKPDPVNLYHYYKAHWDKYKVPGEDPRSALRWEIRSQLFYSS